MILQRRNPDGGTTTVPVPDHKELRTGTLLGIIEQSRLPRVVRGSAVTLTRTPLRAHFPAAVRIAEATSFSWAAKLSLSEPHLAKSVILTWFSGGSRNLTVS